MRPERRWNQETAVRVAAFGALAALAGAQWMRLVESPPVGRVAIAVGVATAAAALIATIAAVQPRATARALAALAALVATAAGLVWIGIPAHLLDPGSWGELLDEIGGGFSGLAGNVEYPYHGENEWSRNVLLAGLPLALGLAAALAFWPGTESQLVRRTAPLVILVATFGVGATVFAPEQPLLWGALLLGAILAWLWLPHLSGRDAIAGTVLVVLAGAVALPVAGALDSDEPWLDFREWEFGRGKPAKFDWNHRYGPSTGRARGRRSRRWRATSRSTGSSPFSTSSTARAGCAPKWRPACASSCRRRSRSRRSANLRCASSTSGGSRRSA